MPDRADQYQSYLLRLWRSPDEGDSAWRASLEDTATGEMEGFEDLSSLFAKLRERTIRREPEGDGR